MTVLNDTTQPQRPLFYEGQILGATDLSLAVAYAGDQLARHERHQHLWGIAAGLGLEVDDGALTLAAGVAIDQLGRPIVVARNQRLDADDFDQERGPDVQSDDDLFPVFLSFHDAVDAGGARSLDDCDTNGSATRSTESFTINYGRIGDELRIDEPGFRQVLIGYVSWDQNASEFLTAENSNGSVPRRFAGVRADAVEARGDALSLRTGPITERDVPTVRVDEEKGGRLVFGLSDGSGGLGKDLFSVSATGDLRALGTISSDAGLESGDVAVQSGIVSDGMVVPLPNGVDQARVDDGSVAVHIDVSPRYPGSVPPTGSPNDTAVALVVTVDSGRRVHCRYRWFGGAGATDEVSGTCNYVVIATPTG